jgi:hypothetical protein
MTDFYHMSAKSFAVGDTLTGNGKDKIDPRIEVELEAYKPPEALSRRNAIFARPVTDFSRCGIVNDGYIYRVALEGAPQQYDLSWIGPMQMALLKQKYLATYSRAKSYPDWTAELIEKCCRGYWSGDASDAPVWECLAPALTVVAVLSDRLVNVDETKVGWPPANA